MKAVRRYNVFSDTHLADHTVITSSSQFTLLQRYATETLEREIVTAHSVKASNAYVIEWLCLN